MPDSVNRPDNDELARHLETLQREECYRVDAVLKESPFELTQRVYFEGANGAERGPFIRKFIASDAGLGSAYRRIFEAQRAGRRFKYLPDILECYERDNRLVVVMEHVRGETLGEAVERTGASEELAFDVFPRLCDAVAELYAEFDPPLIHRDLKPSNVILTGESLALIDFGIARVYREGADSDTNHFGTRDFAPPEQFGFGQTGVYSDVYSLGMVLYFCLTGEVPTSAVREGGFRDDRVPEPVRQVILGATNLDPAQRYRDAAALKGAFDRAAQETDELQHEAPARPVDASGRVPLRDRVLKIGLVGVLALACICVIAFLVVRSAGQGGASSASASGSGMSASVAVFESNQAGASSMSSSSGSSGSSTSSSASSASGRASGSGASATAELAAGIQTSAPPKNGFDPATNFTVTAGEVTFQVPSYFLARTSSPDDKPVDYYYAESGSSLAMLMTSTSEVAEIGADEDFDAFKDAYVKGFMESSDNFEELVAATDYQLADCSARIITIRGTVSGIPLTTKAAFFFKRGSTSIGAVALGQSDNTQFDYSSDFAKILASAQPVT